MVSGAWLWGGFAALVILTAAGLRYYLPLARRVLLEGRGRVGDSWVGPLDGAVASLLCLWFLLLGYDALGQEGQRAVGFRDVVRGAVIYSCLVLFLLGLLVHRNISPVAIFGLGREKFFPVLGRALLALAAAYPVLLLVQAMVFGASGGELQPQEVVRFLREAGSPRDRWAVMVMAVVVAPLAEETIFRGYLYPAGKRYLGPFLSLVAGGLIFAALHGHSASVPALFALAVCLGLAYEKTGTLLVPMAMHAVFNAVSVAAILFLP